jgi:HNH endonuclease
MDEKVIVKFWENTEKSNNLYGCWNWKGFLDKSGLPVIRVANGIIGGKQSLKEYSPRQISKYLSGEKISEKKHCLPNCGNKLCVNPEHLVRGDEARFWNKVQKLTEPDSCWIWIGAEDKNGYGKFKVSSNGKDIHIRAHRYSWELFIGRKTSSKFLLCHHCDNPRCVNPHHLFLGTNQDNADDCVSKQRHGFGEKNGASKLTEQQVLEIKRLYHNQQTTIVSLATRYNCGKSTISDIVINKTWKHLL